MASCDGSTGGAQGEGGNQQAQAAGPAPLTGSCTGSRRAFMHPRCRAAPSANGPHAAAPCCTHPPTHLRLAALDGAGSLVQATGQAVVGQRLLHHHLAIGFAVGSDGGQGRVSSTAAAGGDACLQVSQLPKLMKTTTNAVKAAALWNAVQ